jgi:hypothetical protein
MKSFTQSAIANFVAKFLSDNGSEELVDAWNSQENIEAFNIVALSDELAVPIKKVRKTSDKDLNAPKLGKSTSWRVMHNPRIWDQARYAHDFTNGSLKDRRIAQSKGCCTMVSCPEKGDTVSFVSKGRIVMKGIIESNGFQLGTDHQEDVYNTGGGRAHAIPLEFAWIRIIEVGLSEPIRRTGQRTWAKMPN